MLIKKSFILYTDQLSVLDDLTPEQCAELFMAIKAYHNNEELDLSPIVKIAFSPFKNQFSRDSEKYGKIVEKRIEAGRKGGNQKKQNIANASKCKQTVANLPVTVNDTVNGTVNVNGTDKNKSIVNTDGVNPCPYQQIVDLYHKKLPKNPQVAALSPARKAQIKARWNNGLPDMDAWSEYFDYVGNSAFLTGKVQPMNGRRVFTANIDFLIKEANVLKVYEGNYDD